jgi:hypothetical protein
MMLRLAILCTLFCAHAAAWAHKASDSYLMVEARGAAVSVQWDIALRDIDFAVGLDGDGDGDITWGELRTRQPSLQAWALSSLDLQRGGICPLQLDRLQVDEHTDGAYAVLHISATCPASDGELALAYRLLFDMDNLHRGLLRVSVDGTTHTTVLSPTSGVMRWGTQAVSWLDQFQHYLVEGIWHIWIGFDHILFLVSLLLPAVLLHSANRWRGVHSIADAGREVLWVVTSFTAAHSVTLSAAALGWITLPSRLVESAIALSVVLAAANNLWPVVTQRRWLVAFCFGLIHGFGFASVLAELGLPADALVLSLTGFNLGVEAGQLAIVAVFLPTAYWLRNTPFYQRGIFVGGSVVTMLVAMVWLAERAFDLKLISP